MSLTKTKLVEGILRCHMDISRLEAAQYLEVLLGIMKQTLEDGEDIMITGFGKFCVKEKKKRKGRNPATGKDLFLDARRIVTFRCSEKLRKRINER